MTINLTYLLSPLSEGVPSGVANLDTALNALRLERGERQRDLRRIEALINELESLASSSHVRPTEGSAPPSPITLLNEALSTLAGGTNRSTGARAALIEIFNEQPERSLSADDALLILTQRGWRSSSPQPRGVVASTLSNMVRARELIKVAAGLYALPNSNRKPEVEVADQAQLENGDT